MSGLGTLLPITLLTGWAVIIFTVSYRLGKRSADELFREHPDWNGRR